MSTLAKPASQAKQVTQAPARTGQIRKYQVLKRLAREQPIGIVAAVGSVLLVLIAIFAPIIAPYDPTQQFYRFRLTDAGAMGPSGIPFYLGTDEIGRDLLSRLIWGARSSLTVAFFSVGMGTVIGSALGIVSGYFRGKTDLVMQRVMDSFQAVPTLLLAMILMSVLGISLINLTLVIGITQIPSANRIVRSAVFAVRENLYVTAAISLGATHRDVLLKYIFPNVFAPIIVVASTKMGQAIIVEGSLSFLGLGVPPPTPDWGAMVNSGRELIGRAPQLVLYPSAAVSLAVLAFNLAGDALRDVLDPKLRAR